MRCCLSTVRHNIWVVPTRRVWVTHPSSPLPIPENNPPDRQPRIPNRKEDRDYSTEACECERPAGGAHAVAVLEVGVGNRRDEEGERGAADGTVQRDDGPAGTPGRTQPQQPSVSVSQRAELTFGGES